MTDMPKVELAIGSILVTIEHERSDTRLDYRDLSVPQNCLRYLLSCFYLKSIFRIFQIVFNWFYIRKTHGRTRLEGCRITGSPYVYPSPSKVLRQSFASRVHENREFFSATAKLSCQYERTSWVPPRVLVVWAKTLQPCEGKHSLFL